MNETINQTGGEIMDITRKQIHNAANFFLREYGDNITKWNVCFSIKLNKRTAKLWDSDREVIINRIWRRIKVIKAKLEKK